MKFRRNLVEIQTKFRRNLEEIRTQNLDKIQMYPKTFRCFQIIFRQNLDIIQMNLDMDCPKNLDKIQTKFRHEEFRHEKFRQIQHVF